MTFEILFLVLSPLMTAVIFLIIYLWNNSQEEKSNDSDELYKQLTFKRQVEKARQTYEELKAIIGKEKIDEIFNGYSSNDMIEVLNHIGNMMSLAGCSMSEMADAFNAIASQTEENARPTEQKEVQQIFEPNYEIIKEDMEEPNTLDNWYDNFMKEIEQG